MASSEQASGLDVRLEQDAPIPLAAAFHCMPGELLALVGPSGSGKSTILRSIAGLYRPARGKVSCGDSLWMDNAENVHLPPQQRSVGFVFQQYALFPHLSAHDNVVAALGNRPSGERAKRARELLALVNLEGLEQRRPRALSGGQQQRVALARALARDPAVLLLDEPFSAVDQVTRRKLRRELAQLRRKLNLPIVFVTHDLEEAAMLGDRMCALSNGVTLQTGPPFEVMHQPANVTVARLVDLSNLYEAEVVAHDPKRSMTSIRWHDQTLEARYAPQFPLRHRVCWVIPPENVLLHRRDRPSRGERENPVAGVIAEFVPLGETASVTVRVDGDPDTHIAMTVPTHVAQRNRLSEGGPVKVSLLQDGIHLMPWEPGHQ